MREILFRGKSVDNVKWVYGAIGYHKYRKKYYICDEELENYEIIPETIGQYTGLKDENEKEIYEGDILYFSYDIFTGDFDTKVAKGIVKFIDGAFFIKPFEIEGKKVDDIETEEWFLLYRVNEDTLEVIGNIYDKEVEE